MDTFKNTFRFIILSTALMLGVVLPGFSAPSAFASAAMQDMRHSPTDLVGCLNQHQAQATPGVKTPIEPQKDNKKDPTPPTDFYNRINATSYAGHSDPDDRLVTSSSFRPPDIVINTASLRI